MKKSYLISALVLLAASPGFAQLKVGAAGAPDPSAMLEVTSGTAGNKGLLLPKMTTIQRNAITNPATGLMIYNSTTNQVQVNTGTTAAPVWTTATLTSTGWSIKGNAGTTPLTDFFGTTDNQPLVFRTNNTEKMRVTATGSVGIGTNAPATKLQVSDTGSIAIRVRSENAAPASFELGNANHGLIRNLTASGGDVNDVAVYTSSGSTTGSTTADLYLISNPIASSSTNLPLNQFVLKNTGRVGIGTNAPAARLHIDSGAIRISNSSPLAEPAIQVINDNGGVGNSDNVLIRSYGAGVRPSLSIGTSRGTFAAPANSQAGDIMGNFYSSALVNGSITNLNLIQSQYLGDGTTSKSRMLISTSNALAMSIDSSGFVGVGVGSPQQTLHVAGTARITGSSGTATTITGRDADGDLSNVAIGTGLSLTGGTLTATPGGNNWGLTGNSVNPATNFLGTTNSQPLAFRTNNTEKMRVTATGSVGIGTNAPATKLQVSDTGSIAIRVRSENAAPASFELGNANHGLIRNLTASGGDVNDVAVYTSSGSTTGSTTADLYLISNPIASNSTNLPLNQFVLKNTGRVGIGTNAPAARLHIDSGAIRISNSSPSAEPAIHIINDNGGVGNSDNILIRSYGAGVLPSLSTGSARGTFAAPANSQAGDIMGNYYFSAFVNGAITNLNSIQSQYLGNGTTSKSRMLISTSNALAMTIDSSTNIGIGVGSPKVKLHLNGGVLFGNDDNPSYGNGSLIVWSTVRSGIGETELVNYHGTGSGGFRFYDVDPGASTVKATSGDWIAFITPVTGAYAQKSDARVKSNVNTINGGLEKVMALHPVSYDLHTGRTLKNGIVSFAANDRTVKSIGFLAQELEKVVPEAVIVPKDPANELYSVSYATVVPLLTKAIQELNAKVDKLMSENAQLRADASSLAELTNRIKQLEQLVLTNTTTSGAQTTAAK